MNTRSQLIVDKYIAKPLGFMLNFLVRLLGKILRINHDLDKNFKTIAICKFKGMGSIIQSTTMIGVIREKYPEAEIIYVSSKPNEKILQKITWVDTIILVDDSGFFKMLVSTLKAIVLLIRKRPDVYFDLEIYSDFSTLFTTFTMSVNRVGFYLRSSSFRMGIYTHMMFFNPRVPLSHVYLQLTKLINCDEKGAKIFPLYEKLSLDGVSSSQYIVINPNASDLRLERRWGKEKFIELINLILKNKAEYNIVLIGSKGEQEYTDKIASKINHERVINTAGRTSLEELIGIVSNAKMMVSNDTGPMHISFATSTPVVCLFGPCSPEQFGVDENAHVVYKQVYCSPCVHDFEIAPCGGNNICMQLISTDEVFQKVNEVLSGEIGKRSKEVDRTYYRKGDVVLGKVIR